MTTKHLKLIAIIRSIINRRREKSHAARAADMRRRFSVAERRGTMWLTLDGVAFREIPADTTADEVTSLLADARIAALVFASGQ